MKSNAPRRRGERGGRRGEMQRENLNSLSLLRVFLRVFCVSAAVFILSGCDDSASTATFAHDFATPQGAILKLEDAYRAKDLEAAVACKDFRREAQLILTGISKDQLSRDPKLIDKTAQLLELAFRKEIRENGFPDFRGVKCSFTNQRNGANGTVIVTEVYKYPDGGSSTQQLQVCKTDKGWRVLAPLEQKGKK